MLAGLQEMQDTDEDDEPSGPPSMMRLPAGKLKITITKDQSSRLDPVDRTCVFPLGLVGTCSHSCTSFCAA